LYVCSFPCFWWVIISLRKGCVTYTCILCCTYFHFLYMVGTQILLN
jgi:hypothetical protein